MLIWGAKDPIIPLEHGRRAHELMLHSRLEVFPGAGHFRSMMIPSASSRS
jgi:pimeloyl-ACP methyl ester carboxylesterase